VDHCTAPAPQESGLNLTRCVRRLHSPTRPRVQCLASSPRVFMYAPSHLVIQPMVLSPVGGVEGLASPVTPSTFAAPTGPHTRGGHRQQETNQGYQQQNQQHQPAYVPQHTHTQTENPWGAAASNPFPHQQNGATMSYYSGAQPAANASALHAHPRIQFDPTTSSFTMPSGGGGGGMSPPPDDYLPTTSKGGKRRSTVRLFNSVLLHKQRLVKWAVSAAVIVALIVVVIVVRGRAGGTGTPSLVAREASRTVSASGRTVDSSPVLLNHRSRDASAVASSGRTPESPTHLGHRKRDEPYRKQAEEFAATRAKKDQEKTVLAKGMEEINKLKKNLKEMKQKLKAQLKEKAREAKALLSGSKSTPVDDVAEEDQFEESSEEPDNLPDSSNEVAEEIEVFKAELAGVEKQVLGEASKKAAKEDAMSEKRLDLNKDEKDGNYDWHVTEWSACSVSCGTGVQTREAICQHARTGKRVSNRICTEYDPAPRDVKVCEMEPCADEKKVKKSSSSKSAAAPEEVEAEVSSESSSAEVIPPPPRTAATLALESATSSWPTLSQYAPPFSVLEVAAPESCPVRLWGRSFIEEAWLESKELQCGVDVNPDEHASLELVRFPSENLPGYTATRSKDELAKEQLTDSFFKLRHGLFHPTAVRYSTTSKDKVQVVTKEHVDKTAADGADARTPDWALSLDCTARPELKARSHVDPAATSFLQSLHFLNPHAPPLVTPSDPRSKSIFTRAFERMTDKEFDTTTILMHRNCQAPYSAAQCMGDLFAVYTIAHALKSADNKHAHMQSAGSMHTNLSDLPMLTVACHSYLSLFTQARIFHSSSGLSR
jgi:hypothetical protein